MSEIPIVVCTEYGWVVLVGVSTVLLNFWLGFNVVRARQKFKIDCPIMYCLNNKLFNCIQRAHQNSLEHYPQFLMMLFIGGIDYPVPAAIAGTVWIFSRIVYALGYYTGDPQKRLYGSFGYLAEAALMFFTIKFAVRILGCFPTCPPPEPSSCSCPPPKPLFNWKCK